MADLIDRQAAIDVLDAYQVMVENGEENPYSWARLRMSELPSAQPEVLAHGEGELIAQPEIIRCKDCDWWTKQEDSVQGRCELMQMYPAGGWYCGNARRRGGDSDE